MSALPQVAHRYTVEEYLQLERETGEKWEFFDGEVYRWEAMAGTTPPHSKISNNVGRCFDNAFIAGGRPCTGLTADTKLSVVRMRRYRYLDFMVVCGEPKYDGKLGDALLNPALVIEVLSDSSRKGDQTTKFDQYTKIAAIRDYALIEQDRPLLILHSREHHREPWRTTIHTELSEEIHFPSVEVGVVLGELYRDLVWEEGEPRLAPGAGLPTYQAREEGHEAGSASGSSHEAH